MAGLGNTYDFFAAGGAASGSDTVPAMLTPGEWVMQPKAVKHFGAGLMEAINNLRLPLAALAGFLATSMPMPAVAHYATGGMVGNAPFLAAEVASGASAMPAGKTEVNNYASAEDLFTRANVQRLLVPILEDIAKKSGRR